MALVGSRLHTVQDAAANPYLRRSTLSRGRTQPMREITEAEATSRLGDKCVSTPPLAPTEKELVLPAAASPGARSLPPPTHARPHLGKPIKLPQWRNKCSWKPAPRLPVLYFVRVAFCAFIFNTNMPSTLSLLSSFLVQRALIRMFCVILVPLFS